MLQPSPTFSTWDPVAYRSFHAGPAAVPGIPGGRRPAYAGRAIGPPFLVPQRPPARLGLEGWIVPDIFYSPLAPAEGGASGKVIVPVGPEIAELAGPGGGLGHCCSDCASGLGCSRRGLGQFNGFRWEYVAIGALGLALLAVWYSPSPKRAALKTERFRHRAAVRRIRSQKGLAA